MPETLSSLAEARDILANSKGKEYWRSLDELAQSPAFQDLLDREFSGEEGAWTQPLSRRRFLALLGASVALAGLSGCGGRPPRENIFPYVRQPEEITPGRPLYFATAMPLAGYGTGLLVESHMGRPTKVEGNPEHPGSILPADSPPHARFGPAHLFAQASTLTFYDPDRSQTVNKLGDISSWETFSDEMVRVLRGRQEEGVDRSLRLRVLTETVTSPVIAWQLRLLRERFPEARWHVYQPVGRDNARLGARHAFGQDVETRYEFDKAKVILSLDADFLSCGPGHLRYVRDFSARRKVRLSQPDQSMNRLYVVESTHTVTGAAADHRLPMKSAEVEGFAQRLFQKLQERIDRPANWLEAVAKDLQENRGASVVIAGDGQPPLVHALAHAMNDALGNVGQTVFHMAAIEVRPPGDARQTDMLQSVKDLAQAMAAPQRDGRPEVEALIILGGNPVYNAPADLRFAEKMARVPFLVHLSLYADETSEVCHWHIPETHYLESWGDVRAFDGTGSLIQPLIAPLYQGRSASEVLALLTGQPHSGSHDILRAHWREHFSSLTNPNPANFEAWWRKALHDGKIEGAAAATERVTLQETWRNAPGVAAAARAGLEIVFRPDPGLFDGRFANNGWLLEFPRPITKVTWDNVVLISPATAIRLGLATTENTENANGKIVSIRLRERTVEGPLYIMPGHADDSVTVHLGFGRTKAGRVGTNIGFNAYKLRDSAAPWFDGGVVLEDTGRRQVVATTQQHHLMHNRDLVRSGTLETPPTIPRQFNEPRRTISLYPDHPWEGNQWGMSIDLALCTGCSSCIIACQAENNIPVVGKEQVANGREMHWLRVDTYYSGEPTRPEKLETYQQPVPCMHCENAPCELVCPVMATAHSTDGLNDMVYNRCVGTRYCSNNCPYKVRRFNFLEYSDYTTESRRLGYNPNVTVRTRGVMEKCTYCVQRIRLTQIEARGADRPIGDGEIQTACQSACPAGAIVFGDLNASTRVAQLQREPLNYGLLADLNTRPRTTYLAALRNPNPLITRLQEGGR